VIKKTTALSAIMAFASIFSLSAHAELYTNFYNNSGEALYIKEINLGGGEMKTNALVGMEIKPQPSGYPPHIWFKATGRVSDYYRKVVIASKTNPNNWCRFEIPYNLSTGLWTEEIFYSARTYAIESNGTLRCYINDLNDNTAHLNINQ